MSTYLIPIKTAIFLFPFIAFLFTFPFAIYQYRKHGYINKLRVFILYSFLLFLITAYFLVILPLPKTRDIRSLQKAGTKHYQLIPFNFIHDFIKETNIDFQNIHTYKYILKDRSFLQAAFNAILLTPLGIYLRYYFKKDLKKTVLITFLISLFFEITQLSALYGFYNAPYRIFDIDDLILNTLGGFIGYWIAPMFTFFLPNSSNLDKNIDLEVLKVGIFRRFFALGIDWLILSIFLNKNTNFIEKAFGIYIYFILIVYITNGLTLGKAIVRIKIKGPYKKLTLKEVVLRYGILYFGIIGGNYILKGVLTFTNNELIYSVVSIFGFIINIILIFHFIFCIITNNRFFYEKLSNTRNIIIK